MAIDALVERLKKLEQVEVDLKRLDRMLQAAHRSSIDIKDSYDFYVIALKEFNKENIAESCLYHDRARYELTIAINEAKIKINDSRFHSSRTLSYFVNLYGLYAMLFASLTLFLFSFLINSYSDVSLMGVPLWSSFFAGLGSSTQILTGVAGDLCRYDVASRYKRFWYMALPLLSMVFGYMAYLIFSSSFMALNLNDNSQSREFSIMLICFLTGFLTKWLIGRSLLSRV
jgi:uncharacterized membrane protein